VLPERPWSSLVKSRDPDGGSLGWVVEVLALSLSSDTSSMSDVTEMRCAVRSGDLSAETWSPGFAAAASSFIGRGTAGRSGGGELSRLSWEDDVDESHLLSSERGRDRSDCESGRGVISEASSKSSPPLSELCTLVGRSLLLAMAGSGAGSCSGKWKWKWQSARDSLWAKGRKKDNGRPQSGRMRLGEGELGERGERGVDTAAVEGVPVKRVK